jgi:EpsD family peptidyl-prolyl cis-trans isomerase
MQYSKGGLVIAVVSMTLAGCHLPGFGDKKPPTGQVIAKIDGREITLRELNAEIGDQTFSDPKARKRAEQQALSNIVARVILADDARKQGIDKTPEFAIAKSRAVDDALVEALQRKIAADIPQPTRAEAQEFVNTNVDIFSQRKVFEVDQIRMPRPSDPAILKSLEPLKTMEQVEDVLKAAKIPYQRSSGTLDSVGADPRTVQQILKLPPNEVFVIPGTNGLLVNQIRDTKVVPFTGEQAVDYAMKYIARDRTQESIRKSFNQTVMTALPTVQFNKDYAPPKPTHQGAGAASNEPGKP